MEASEIQDVCRLCPENGISSEPLLNVFNRKFGDNINMKDVIFITTGIEIMETDLVSRKICQRCRNIIIKMNNFRQDAIKHDKALKEKCNKILFEKGFRLPDYPMTKQEIKPEPTPPCSKLKTEISEQTHSRKREIFLHPSVQQIYKKYPNLTVPKVCINRHMAPVVSLSRETVEKYLRASNLDLSNSICPSNGNLKDSPLNIIARKKTSAVAGKRKVTPIKISKRLFGSQGTSYVCSSTLKPSLTESDSKKRLASPSENNQKNKILKQDGSPLHSELIVEATNLESKESPHSNCTPEILRERPEASTKKTHHNLEMKQQSASSVLRTPHSQEKSGTSSTPQGSESVETSKTPQSPVKSSRNLSEHSVKKDKSVSIPSSVISTCSSDSRSELVEDIFLNLTPRVKTVKSQKLCHCPICGDVLHNVFELRRHNLKHSVCQFCKRKCKSVEDKKIHVRNFCEIKKIMNQRVSVSLERIHLNLSVRKTYQNAFTGFEAIPRLVEPKPAEEVAVCATPSPSNIIVLSDDEEENQTKEVSVNTPAVATEEPSQIVYHTVAIVKPDVRIKHSDVLENLPPTLTDKMLLKELIELNAKPTTVNRMSNTDLPTSKDIHTSISNSSCEFKNLKEQLMFFKVPIEINNGPFHIGYRFQEAKTSKKAMQLWNLVPLVDVKAGAGRDKGKDIATSNSVIRHSSQLSNAVLSVTTSGASQPAITKSSSHSSWKSKVKNTSLTQSPATPNGKPPQKSNTVITTPPTQLNATTVVNNIPPLQPVVTTSGIHVPNSVANPTLSSASIPPLRQSQPLLLIRPPASTEASCATPLLNNYYVRSMSSSLSPHSKLTPIPKSYINAAMNIRNMTVVSSANATSQYPSSNSTPPFIMNSLLNKQVPLKYTQVNIPHHRPVPSASAGVNSARVLENSSPSINASSSSAAAVSVPSSVPMPSPVPFLSLPYVLPPASGSSLPQVPPPASGSSLLRVPPPASGHSLPPVPPPTPTGLRSIRVKNVKELQ